MNNSKNLDYNAMKMSVKDKNCIIKNTEYQLYSHKKLIENDDRKNYIKSTCMLLENSKLDMVDVKILSEVVLNAVKKMSNDDDYSELKVRCNSNLMEILKNENNRKEDYSKSIFNLLQSSKLDMYDVKQLSQVVLKTVEKLTDINDCSNSHNISGYYLSPISIDIINNKDYKNGYEADISNENTSNNQTCEESSPNFQYKQKEISNISTMQSPHNLSNHENTNKTSSSGVYTESVNEYSNGSDCSDLDIVTRIIEDSCDESLSDSRLDSDTNGDDNDDDFYWNDSISDYNGHLLAGNGTLGNVSLSASLHSDSLNRSTSSWLGRYSTDCDCDSCLDRLLKENLSISSSRTDAIDPHCDSLRQSLHCENDHLCLLCIQQKKRAQTFQNSFLFK